jgi:hypothetical protein
MPGIRDNLDGRKFGHLTPFVLAPPFRTSGGQLLTRWYALCDCGRERIVRAADLKAGKVKCCAIDGCQYYQGKKSRPYSERLTGSPENVCARRVSITYRRNAMKRGIVYSLLDSEVKSIIFSKCHYCDSPPRNITTQTRLCYGGIDRVDNKLGYVTGNVVPCCRQCNTMKLDMTVQELAEKVRILYLKLCTP